jgi:hypothetical protein
MYNISSETLFGVGVARFNVNGTLESTRTLPRTGGVPERVNRLDVDARDNVHIVGYRTSYPVRQVQYRVLRPDLTDLASALYGAGQTHNLANSLVVRDNGIVVIGGLASDNFPATPGTFGYYTTVGGEVDGLLMTVVDLYRNNQPPRVDAGQGGTIAWNSGTADPLFRDFSQQDATNVVSVRVTNDQGESVSVPVSLVARDWQAPTWPHHEMGALENINNTAGTSGTIERNGQAPAVGVVGINSGRSVVWSRYLAGAYSLYELRGDFRSPVAENERLLAVAEAAGQQVLLSWNSATQMVLARMRATTDTTALWSEAAAVAVGTPGPTYGEGSLAWCDGKWYGAVMKDEPEDPTVYVYQFNGSAWSLWAQYAGRFAQLISGPDGNLMHLVLINGSNELESHIYQDGVWTDNSIAVAEPPLGMGAVVDSAGHLWCLVARAGEPAWEVDLYTRYATRSGPKFYYGSLQKRATPVATDLAALPEGRFAAADNNGWVYWATTPQSSGQTGVTRAEMISASEVRITTGTAPISRRAVAGRYDGPAAIEMNGGPAGYITWQPAQATAGALYLAGRPYRNFITLANGKSHTLDKEVDVQLGLANPAGLTVRIYGDATSAVIVDGASMPPGTSFNYATTQSIRVLLKGDVHGVPTTGTHTVWAQFADPNDPAHVFWPIRDSIIYVDPFDVRVTGIEIRKTDGSPIGEHEVIAVRSGEPYQFRAIVTWSPLDWPWPLDETDLAWTGSFVGPFANGSYRGGKMGLETITATRPRSDVADQVRVHVDTPGELAYYDIYPAEDVLVGLNEPIRFRAVGRDAAGNAVAGEPQWSVYGPGEIGPTGLYVCKTPTTAFGGDGEGVETAEIVASDRRNPNIRSSKPIRVDRHAPVVENLTMTAASGRWIPDGGATSGTVAIGWELAESPEEISTPVKYVAMIDNRIEIRRLTSEEPTTTSWNTASVPDGEHLLTILAEDARGNSNESGPAQLRFIVQNGIGATGPTAGIDWLLVHQWRESDEYFGSWKQPTVEPRPHEELIIEAAFAAWTLGSSDLTYVCPVNGLKTARAYHDAIVWLGEQVGAQTQRPDREGGTSGAIENFAIESMVMESLAQGAGKKSRLVYELGSVAAEFDEAIGAVEAFLNRNGGLLSRIDAGDGSREASEGGFARGEESLATRFETVLAWRVAAASGSDALKGELLARSLGFFRFVTALSESNVRRREVNRDGFADAPHEDRCSRRPDRPLTKRVST